EIQRLQKETGITMVYVTHDRREAMAMGTKIALINGGRIIEVGSPLQLYFHPQNRYTAEFLGEINIIRGRVGKITTNYTEILTEEGTLTIAKIIPLEGKEIEMGFRPENIHLYPADKQNVLTGVVKEIEYSGETAKVRIETKKGNNFFLRLLSREMKNIQKDCELSFSISPDDLIVFS
ncbi:MAG: TOBE domain-containing protein, partial [Candidatus Ratteibacteria bacterium]|nr:TOBE domain-containing protein [Candidatus Ratteibacteria bacterium]